MFNFIVVVLLLCVPFFFVVVLFLKLFCFIIRNKIKNYNKNEQHHFRTTKINILSHINFFENILFKVFTKTKIKQKKKKTHTKQFCFITPRYFLHCLIRKSPEITDRRKYQYIPKHHKNWDDYSHEPFNGHLTILH